MCGEVPDDVGSVTTPEGEDTLLTVDTAEAVNDTLVGRGETTLLDLNGGKLTGQRTVREKANACEFTISSWFCTKSLIRSMGAAEVLATA